MRSIALFCALALVVSGCTSLRKKDEAKPAEPSIEETLTPATDAPSPAATPSPAGAGSVAAPAS